MSNTQVLGLLLCTGTLLGEQHCLDVGQDATLGDGNSSQKLVQLLVVPRSKRIRHPIAKILILPDSKLEVPWNDARLLVVPGSVTSQLQDLGSQVLHDCCHVDWSTSTNSLGIVALPTHAVEIVHIKV